MTTYAAIIQEDWSDYNLRKMRTGSKVNDFQPCEGWEVNYLASKILKFYPYQDKNVIKEVVSAFAEFTTGPLKRELLVEMVMTRLSLG